MGQVRRLRGLVRDGVLRRATGASVERLEERRLLAAVPTDMGLQRELGMQVQLDYDNNGAPNARLTRFGRAGDMLVAGDFNGNTVSDLALYRPATGVWYVMLTKTKRPGLVHPWKLEDGATPVAGDINGDGYADFGSFKDGVWTFDTDRNRAGDVTVNFGGPGDKPLVWDVDADGLADLVTYNAGTWRVDTNRDGAADLEYTFGNFGAGDVPVIGDPNADTIPDLGVFTDGVWRWDTNRDGTPDAEVAFGQAGDKPITGYYNTAGSVFINPNAKRGRGTETSPISNISLAAQKVKPGTVIRLSAGTHSQKVYFWGRDNVTFMGAGRYATRVAPPTGDAFLVDNSTNVWFLNMNFRAASENGRGVALLGSTAWFRGVDTTGTMGEGVVSTDYKGKTSAIDAYNSHFDNTIRGVGMFLNNGTTAKIDLSTFNNNGTLKEAIPATAPLGRGLVLLGDSVATVDRSQIDGNWTGGAFVRTTAKLTIRNSTLSRNVKGNGLIALDASTLVLEDSLLEANGEVRTAAAGLNGLEIYENFTGSAKIVGNTFRNNTANGIYVSNGQNIEVLNNLFDNNLIGLGINGLFDGTHTTVPYPDGKSHVIVKGNTFRVPADSTPDDGMEEGIFSYGGKAGAVIGGTTAAERNRFENYKAQLAIDGKDAGGCPAFEILDNEYINSPDPIQHWQCLYEAWSPFAG